MKKVNTNVNHFDPLLEGERKELVAEVETTQDMYTDDTIADPEGAAAREEAEITAIFPDWVYGDYELSPKTLWGKAWPDGKDHLVPKQITIDAVIDLHKQGEQHYREMVKLAYSTDETRIKALIDGFETALAGCAGSDHFPLLKGIGDQVQTFLAERAYRKYLFVSAADRHNDDAMPDYVENLHTNMMTAAANAGVWYELHSHCWNYVQWKNAPRYYVDNAIKLRLVNAARYLDENYRSEQPKLAKTSDYVKTAVAC